MTPTGPNYPLTVTDNPARGVSAWSDPTHATADDANNAAVTLTNFAPTAHYLAGVDCGFTIPTTATVTGVQVEVARSRLNTVAVDGALRLILAGAITGDDKSAGATIPTTMTTAAFGGPTDLWGLTLTPAAVNAANFGAAYAADRLSANGFVYVNFLRLTVYYTLPAPVAHAGSLLRNLRLAAKVAGALAP